MSALNVAEGLIVIARKLLEQPEAGALFGPFHTTGCGEPNRAGPTKAIFAAAAQHGRHPARGEPISTVPYPAPAARPANAPPNGSKLSTIMASNCQNGAGLFNVAADGCWVSETERRSV